MAEAGIGHDRLFLNEVPFQRGQDLLIRHVFRRQHRKALEDELLRGQQVHEAVGIGQVGQDLLLSFVRQWWHLSHRGDLQKTSVQVRLKMALQARLRIGRGEDQGILEVEVDPVDLVQDKRIGVQDFDLGEGLAIHVHASAERPVLIRHPEACKGRGGIEALQMEGEQGGRIRLFP